MCVSALRACSEKILYISGTAADELREREFFFRIDQSQASTIECSNKLCCLLCVLRTLLVYIYYTAKDPICTPACEHIQMSSTQSALGSSYRRSVKDLATMGPVWVATFAYYGGTRKESRSIITRVDAIMWNVKFVLDECWSPGTSSWLLRWRLFIATTCNELDEACPARKSLGADWPPRDSSCVYVSLCRKDVVL